MAGSARHCSPMPNARILIADDDAAILQTMTWVLKEHGYDVVGGAAREAASCRSMEERTPDLVLLDVHVPDADGYQILERIKSDERWRDVPVVMISALPPEEAAVRTLGLGAADFVRKPFRVKELLARIQAQLRMRAILRSAHERCTNARARAASGRGRGGEPAQAVDILHDVTDDLSADEIYHLLARRVARALELTHCSVILARQGAARASSRPRSRRAGEPRFRAGARPSTRRSGRRWRADDRCWSKNVHDEPAVRGRARALGARRDAVDHAFGHRIAVRAGSRRRRASSSCAAASTSRRSRRATSSLPTRSSRRRWPRSSAPSSSKSTMADNRRLEQLAHTDPLTEVLNRRALTERLGARNGACSTIRDDDVAAADRSRSLQARQRQRMGTSSGTTC